eukprot:2878444-Rhodomonas_salina.2
MKRSLDGTWRKNLSLEFPRERWEGGGGGGNNRSGIPDGLPVLGKLVGLNLGHHSIINLVGEAPRLQQKNRQGKRRDSEPRASSTNTSEEMRKFEEAGADMTHL